MEQTGVRFPCRVQQMQRIEQEYYMIDEFKGAERVLIRSVSEINIAWIRIWVKENPISCVHVFGAAYFLKCFRNRCLALGLQKTNPIALSCRFLADDCLEIKKPFNAKIC